MGLVEGDAVIAVYNPWYDHILWKILSLSSQSENNVNNFLNVCQQLRRGIDLTFQEVHSCPVLGKGCKRTGPSSCNKVD